MEIFVGRGLIGDALSDSYWFVETATPKSRGTYRLHSVSRRRRCASWGDVTPYMSSPRVFMWLGADFSIGQPQPHRTLGGETWEVGNTTL